MEKSKRSGFCWNKYDLIKWTSSKVYTPKITGGVWFYIDSLQVRNFKLTLNISIVCIFLKIYSRFMKRKWKSSLLKLSHFRLLIDRTLWYSTTAGKLEKHVRYPHPIHSRVSLTSLFLIFHIDFLIFKISRIPQEASHV